MPERNRRMIRSRHKMGRATLDRAALFSSVLALVQHRIFRRTAVG